MAWINITTAISYRKTFHLFSTQFFRNRLSNMDFPPILLGSFFLEKNSILSRKIYLYFTQKQRAKKKTSSQNDTNFIRRV